MHVYVEGFRKVLSLLNLERVVGGGSSNNFTLLSLIYLEECGGMIIEQIANKVVCFGSNGVLVYIGVHTSVATQLKSKVTPFCHDLSLGFASKARACKGASQEGSSRVTFHALGSVEECEGMNRTLPSGLPLWESSLDGVLMNFRIFRKVFQRSNFIGLKSSLYH
jgi:hypothetical protein